MKPPIIKIPAEGMYIHELLRRLGDPEKGFKFTLKIKRNKRYKLRSFRMLETQHRHCECCGNYVMTGFRNSRRSFDFDTHLGECYVNPHSIC